MRACVFKSEMDLELTKKMLKKNHYVEVFNIADIVPGTYILPTDLPAKGTMMFLKEREGFEGETPGIFDDDCESATKLEIKARNMARNVN